MSKIFLVGVGGFIGAALRYVLSGYVQNLTQSIAFPHGTLTVNLIGCFLIGVFCQLVEMQAGMTEEMRLMLMLGLLGSFTTFSTFSSETLNLLIDRKLTLALINIGTHIILGITAVVVGRFAIVKIWR